MAGRHDDHSLYECQTNYSLIPLAMQLKGKVNVQWSSVGVPELELNRIVVFSSLKGQLYWKWISLFILRLI